MFGMDKLSLTRVITRVRVTRRRTKVRRAAKFVHSKSTYNKKKHRNFCDVSSFSFNLKSSRKLYSV